MSLIKRLDILIRSLARTTTERINQVAAKEELREALGQRESVVDRQVPTEVNKVLSPNLEADYRYLGLTPGADLAKVEAAWRRLAMRADPKRFPQGSAEAKRAAELLKSLNEAYYRIREALNPTEGRFGRLEL